METAVTSGIYYQICECHQLLLEYDMTLLNNPGKDEEILNIGGMALGYNLTISEKVELINQLYYDIPQNDEDHSFGISVGTIITL